MVCRVKPSVFYFFLNILQSDFFNKEILFKQIFIHKIVFLCLIG